MVNKHVELSLDYTQKAIITAEDNNTVILKMGNDEDGILSEIYLSLMDVEELRIALKDIVDYLDRERRNNEIQN